jgi:hypothetical protein
MICIVTREIKSEPFNLVRLFKFNKIYAVQLKKSVKRVTLVCLVSDWPSFQPTLIPQLVL